MKNKRGLLVGLGLLMVWAALVSPAYPIIFRPTHPFNKLPNYDSGWIALGVDQTRQLTHSLGGDVNDYFVDMEYRSTDDGINQRYLGGADFGNKPAPGHAENDRVGAYWRSLTTSSITVYRRPEDSYAAEIRVRIWVHSAPKYDSGWRPIDQNAALTLMHNALIDTDNMFVNLDYRDSDANGINQRCLGGADFGNKPAPGHVENDRVGAYWRTLTTSSVIVYRRPEDTYAPDIRLRIWQATNPVYNSGWVSLTAGNSVALNYNLGIAIDKCLVKMDTPLHLHGRWGQSALRRRGGFWRQSRAWPCAKRPGWCLLANADQESDYGLSPARGQLRKRNPDQDLRSPQRRPQRGLARLSMTFRAVHRSGIAYPSAQVLPPVLQALLVTEIGSQARPYNTLAEGVTAVLSGGTIKLIGTNVSGEKPRIIKAMQLDASVGKVRIGVNGVAIPAFPPSSLAKANPPELVPPDVPVELSEFQTHSVTIPTQEGRRGPLG